MGCDMRKTWIAKAGPETTRGFMDKEGFLLQDTLMGGEGLYCALATQELPLLYRPRYPATLLAGRATWAIIDNHKPGPLIKEVLC